jgi:hydrocephalus-inducing protein
MQTQMHDLKSSVMRFNSNICVFASRRPKQRMLTFKEPLHALVAGVPQVLATLTGASTGMALMLASDSIPFGTVVLGSRTTKRLQLSNHGDLGCRFAWDVRPLGQQFSISPAGAYTAVTCKHRVGQGIEH